MPHLGGWCSATPWMLPLSSVDPENGLVTLVLNHLCGNTLDWDGDHNKMDSQWVVQEGSWLEMGEYQKSYFETSPHTPQDEKVKWENHSAAEACVNGWAYMVSSGLTQNNLPTRQASNWKQGADKLCLISSFSAMHWTFSASGKKLNSWVIISLGLLRAAVPTHLIETGFKKKTNATTIRHCRQLLREEQLYCSTNKSHIVPLLWSLLSHPHFCHWAKMQQRVFIARKRCFHSS